MNQPRKPEDYWRGEITNELRHIAETVREITRQIAALRATVEERFAAHDVYHSANEHRWGPVRWCHLHPVRFGLICAALVALILGVRDFPLTPLLRSLAELLK
ncbi:MAG: hypothetical protein K1X53_15995 [Candidatus Sumerlaeaceae bacterium]|nr:hypothetical protein [Candidatus Sumerlaeaceae bacterium]